MPLMIKLNRNIMKVYLCLDNGHFITVFLFFFDNLWVSYTNRNKFMDIYVCI